MRPSSRLGLALLALGTASALTGCGRRGALELPPGTPSFASTSPANAAAQDRVLNDQGNPGLIQSPNKVIERSPEAKQQVFREQPAPPPINGAPNPPHQNFLLDPLL